LASLKQSPLFGNQDEDGVNGELNSSWPLLNNLQAKNNFDLKNLRLKKIEWGCFKQGAITLGHVQGVRITLSDGTASQTFGNVNSLNESFDFPKDRPIRSVRVRHFDNWVLAL